MGKMDYFVFGLAIAIIVSFIFGFTFFFTEFSKTSNINEDGNEICHIVEQGSISGDRESITYFQCNWSDGSISKCTKTAMGTSCKFINTKFG